MRFNIFSGARRIAILLAALATIATIYNAATFKPFVDIHYDVIAAKPMIRTEAICSQDSHSHHFLYDVKGIGNVHVNFCLLWVESDGERFIPFQSEDGHEWFAAESGNTDLQKYAEKLETRFVIPTADITYLIDEHSKGFWDFALNSLGIWALGMAAFFALLWCIGWIVRGFMGIPIGSDSRS